MTDLIVTPDADADLAWMRKVHRPDELLHAPVQLIETRNRQGQVLVPGPHGLCVRGDAACCARGSLPGVPGGASAEVATWAALTFFATPGLKPLAPMTRDGFERWVRDAKAPTVELCGRCGGKGVDPDAKPDDDGLIAACTRCGGEPRRTDEDAVAEPVGPLRVVVADLKPFLAHLGPGADVGVGWAPRVGVPGACDLHVRHVTAEPRSTGGAWRLCLMALDGAAP